MKSSGGGCDHDHAWSDPGAGLRCRYGAEAFSPGLVVRPPPPGGPSPRPASWRSTSGPGTGVGGSGRGWSVGDFLAWARERGAAYAKVTASAGNVDGIRFHERELFRSRALTLRLNP